MTGIRAGQTERFWAKVDKQSDDCCDCWLWTSPLGAGGYGRCWFDSRFQLPHRVAYELLVGPIPDGLELDHLCQVRHCVRPEHLEPVTPRENQHRSNSFSGRNARKTHCPQGHAYDEANTYWYRGKRSCKACMATRYRTWSAANPGWQKKYNDRRYAQVGAEESDA